MNAALFPDLIVNGETVPHAAVAAEAQNHSAPKGKPGIAWRKAARAMTVRTLLLQEARRRDLAPDPQEVAPGRFEADEEALVRALLESVVEVAPASNDAVRAEWNRDPSRFRAPPLWEVSHILIACDPRDVAATQAAAARAKQLAVRAIEDPQGFARLATSESDCGSKSSGGSLGQLGPGDTVPEFEFVLRTLEEGEITETPVLTRHGWHVIRLDALAEGRVLPFETVRQRIADAIEKATWARNARAFIDQLMADAETTGVDFQTG